jgi:hypothetical protein
MLKDLELSASKVGQWGQRNVRLMHILKSFFPHFFKNNNDIFEDLPKSNIFKNLS